MIELEKMDMKAGFENFDETVSPSDFEIVVRTHARVLYSCPRPMIGHFEEVGLSVTLENIMKLRRPEIFVQPPAWLLYSFLARIFFNGLV